jgi:hypothetical protein
VKPKRKKASEILWVSIREAKPNPMFTEQMRQSVRFLCYSKFLPCAACGKKVKVHWTMLCEFKVGNMEASQFVLQWYPQTFPPLTPTCGDHPLKPAWPESNETKKPKSK